MGTKSKYENQRLIFRDAQEVVSAMAAVIMFDDFLGKALDSTNDWTLNGVNAGTAAINVATGGILRFTTGNADDDDVELASDLIWKASKACCLEVRIANNDVDMVAFNVGFSDDQEATADKLQMTLSGTTLTTNAADFVGFLYDPDANTDTIRCVAVKNAVDRSVIDTAKALTDGEYVVLRIEVDALGNADFYVNGIHKGRLALCITPTDALCIYIGVINHGEGAVNTVDVDYVKAWQNR